eukprot:CAMPEP_0180697896 /NCGR_PEP_ID=MMETSP1038_2-20121128/3739_1 /TAXON_ID=632150 /ORGANISM="Azadinium spinosum, Strain 3D9" /LENGTH=63 /DNA_ID=CAMNT_0022729437 /DNA_START=227 /DNA_END=418 /DNA_ORIENTATION=-
MACQSRDQEKLGELDHVEGEAIVCMPPIHEVRQPHQLRDPHESGDPQQHQRRGKGVPALSRHA